MFILKFLQSVVKLLGSNKSPGELAGGFIIGMIMGLTPLLSLHNLILLLLVILLRVNISMMLAALGLFGGLAYLFDPLFHNLGYWLLVQVPGLQGMWTWFYNTPVLAWFRFNNTVVIGSLVVSLILLLPMYWAMHRFVLVYRRHWQKRIQKWKIVRWFKASKLYTLYQYIEHWRPKISA